MTASRRRCLSFGGSTVAVQYRGRRPTAIVDFLYRHIPEAGRLPPHVVYRLAAARESDQLFLYRDGKLFYRNASDGAVAEILLGDTCHNLAKESRGGLLFHAAALEWAGKGIMLPGTMGAGKTTLAAWLVAKGLRYLTDELVFLPHGLDRIEAFTRPLNLKHPSIRALQDQVDFSRLSDSVLCNAHSCLVPHNLLGSGDPTESAAIGLLLFPHYVPDAEPALEALSRAQAGLALMSCLVNARNLPDHGFHEIARMARLAPGYRLRYGSFLQIEDWLDSLLHLDRPAPEDIIRR